MNETYTQVNFIVSGGALKLLTDYLTPKVSEALIVEPNGDNLQVLDAIGTSPSSLIFGQTSQISLLFTQHPPIAPVEFVQAESSGEWPWVVRIRGDHWQCFILLKEKLDEATLEGIEPYAGLIRLWKRVQRLDVCEQKLARLSYMILATKNTLASIFEPMPFQYYATFVADVLRESLFPSSIAILKDDQGQFGLVTGTIDKLPAREGLYAGTILPPTPVVTQVASAPYEVILPLVEGDIRLFCVMNWDYLPDPLMLNFMGLLGSMAVRAMSINNLRLKNQEATSQVSSGDFTVLSLSNVLKGLKQEKNCAGYLSLASDIFMEQGQMSESLMIVWSKKQGGYVAVDERKGSLKVSTNQGLLYSIEPVQSDLVKESYYSLKDRSLTDILHSWGLPGETPWPMMEEMSYLFPICDDINLVGFIALSSKEHQVLTEVQLAALHIVAQFVAYEFRKFKYCL